MRFFVPKTKPPVLPFKMQNKTIWQRKTLIQAHTTQSTMRGLGVWHRYRGQLLEAKPQADKTKDSAIFRTYHFKPWQTKK